MDTKAAFEKWFLSIGGSVSMTADEKYRTDRARMAWWAWKASRAAIEIELPDGDMHMTYSGHQKLMLPNLGVRNAIASHGIRIKGKTE